MSVEYAIIVRSKTRLESLIDRFNTKSQAKFYIESLGGNFQDYVEEHERFYTALVSLQTKLSPILKNKIIDRTFLPSFLFADTHLIIVIGQDGLVANTAKYANGCPIIAVNPDQQRYDGVLLPFDTNDFTGAVKAVMAQDFDAQLVRFAEARLNDGQRLLAFNDLFIGASSHTSARYRITFSQRTEEHSSSGIIVSTRAGSTGWLSSIFNMAYGVAGMLDQDLIPRRPSMRDNELLFAVREPFKSIRTQTDISAGIVTARHELSIESLMPANGIIFSDGIEKDYLNFNSGAVATIGLAKESATLVSNS